MVPCSVLLSNGSSCYKLCFYNMINLKDGISSEKMLFFWHQVFGFTISVYIHVHVRVYVEVKVTSSLPANCWPGKKVVFVVNYM